MSETRDSRRTDREKRRASTEGGEAAKAAAPDTPVFAVVASGENVVMVNTVTGQTWAMATDGAGPSWHPVSFSAVAPRAPRRTRAKKEGESAETSGSK